MFVNLFISSKSLYSLNVFLIFFLKLLNSKKLKVKVFKKIKINSKHQKNFTVLKSPHVNKTAQEQFKTEIFNYNIYFFSLQSEKILLILKKLNNSLFHDINIKLKVSIDKKKKYRIRLNLINPDNYTLVSPYSIPVSINEYLQIVSYFGKSKIKKDFFMTYVCLNSSVGRAKD